MNWNGIVSLLIACIELILIINLLIFSKKNSLNNLAIVIITILMLYQALEFLMCQFGLYHPFLPYLAYFDITLLPPLNLLLVFTLFKYKKYLFFLFLLIGLSFIAYYTFTINEFAVTSCTVLYATYNYPLGDFYGAFYYTPILISIIVLIYNLNTEPVRRIAKTLLFGNIFLSMPVIIGFILMFTGNYKLISMIESIMCKFAFVYAVCLTLICLHNNKEDERNNS